MKNTNSREGSKEPSQYIIVVDTETTGQGKNLLVYDFSFLVYDMLEQKIILERANLVREVFSDKKLMSGAYYYDKMSLYNEYLKSGFYSLKPFDVILKEFRECIKKFEVAEVWAHNASFDKKALWNTYKTCLFSSSCDGLCMLKLDLLGIPDPLPFGCYWYCSLKLAKQELASDKEYQDFCKKYGFLTKTGKAQLTAETIYRYLKDEPDFEEEHTGLKDAQIELEIIKKFRTEENKATPLNNFFEDSYTI